MRRRLPLLTAIVLLVGFILLNWAPIGRRVRAVELLWGLSREASAAVQQDGIEVVDLTLPRASGNVRARLYRRVGLAKGRAVVLAHGIHYRGIDEARLVPFARQLAQAGLLVLTPELRDLADYRITADGADVIKTAVEYLAKRPEWLDDPKIGILGFSFAGGLSLIAAGDADIRDRVAFVTSVGGHHDLERVLRFFVTQEIETPAGRRQQKAHDYGLVVLIYGDLSRFVPAEDHAVMRNALRFWLQEKPELAWAEASLRTTPAAEHLFQRVAEGRLHELTPELTQLIEARRAELAALSPKGHLLRIRAPVYLLHGSSDNVIPASEAEWASSELGLLEHQALISPLLNHVQVTGGANITGKLQLVEFMGRML